jgi:hypothetical protein
VLRFFIGVSLCSYEIAVLYFLDTPLWPQGSGQLCFEALVLKVADKSSNVNLITVLLYNFRSADEPISENKKSLP